MKRKENEKLDFHEELQSHTFFLQFICTYAYICTFFYSIYVSLLYFYLFVI